MSIHPSSIWIPEVGGIVEYIDISVTFTGAVTIGSNDSIVNLSGALDAGMFIPNARSRSDVVKSPMGFPHDITDEFYVTEYGNLAYQGSDYPYNGELIVRTPPFVLLYNRRSY